MGGVEMYDYFEVDDFARSCFESCLAYLNRDLSNYCGKRLDVQYKTGMEKNEVNAAADLIEKNKYLVTVEIVAINQIISLYTNLLHQPLFYKGVTGKYDEEEYDEKLAFDIAIFLSYITLKMIIFHELGHIFNGHIDYIKHCIQNDEGYSLRNRIETARPFLEEKLWQSLEWNADDFSANRIIGQVLCKDNLAKWTFIQDAGHALFLTEIAAVGMFTIMGMSYECTEIEKKIFKEKEHLPLRFRMNQFISNLYNVANAVGYEYSYNPVRLMPVLHLIEEECVAYLVEVQEKNPEEWSSFSNLEELDDEHRKYYSEVFDFYKNNLVNVLKGYAYFNVLKLEK